MTSEALALEAPRPETCPDQGWRAQFGHPRGLLGRLAGRLMAVKNAEMHDLTVEVLDVQPDDRVLEIGFGHGRMLRMLAERASRGRVAGIDPSDVMVAQAARRNRDFLARGTVELVLGSVSKLPWEDGRFRKVCAVNSFQHWPAPAQDLLEVHRVLARDGLLVLSLRMHDPSGGRLSSPGFRAHEIGRVRALLRDAGFRDVRSEVRELGRRVTCVMANR